MKTVAMILLLVLMAGEMNAQGKADDIVGTWQTEKKDAQLMIYKKGQSYHGKITFMKHPRKDTKNPVSALRTRELMGAEILTNFSFNGKDKWEDGKIYDPSTGKTYACNMKLQNNITLEIRGYIGISLFGRTEVWKRVL